MEFEKKGPATLKWLKGRFNQDNTTNLEQETQIDFVLESQLEQLPADLEANKPVNS